MASLAAVAIVGCEEQQDTGQIIIEDQETAQEKVIFVRDEDGAAEETQDRTMSLAASGFVQFEFVKPPPGDLARTHGSGCLVSFDAILTAKHVAREVERNPSRFRIVLTPGLKSEQLLTYHAVDYVGDKESVEPDLALVRVQPVKEKQWYPPLSFEDVALGDKLFVVGMQRYQNEIVVGRGYPRRAIATRLVAGTYERTVFGASTWSNLGVSGASVFNERGEVVGVQIDGGTEYVRGQEAQIRIKQTGTLPNGEGRYTTIDEDGKEVPFEGWSWIVPLSRFKPQLQTVLSY